MRGLHLGRVVSLLQRPLRTSSPAGEAPTPIVPTPVILGGRPVTQVDETTCGAAVLLMLEASGDPHLVAELDEHPEQISARQHGIHARIRRRAVGPFTWPKRFGSPPWTLAREATFPGVRYSAFAVDDRRPSGRAILHAVWNANAAGLPVPLYTGGNLGQGIERALPRHVVLAVPPASAAREQKLRIYEPSEGMLYDVPLDELMNRSEPHPALGRWTHVVWAILPRPAAP